MLKSFLSISFPLLDEDQGGAPPAADPTVSAPAVPTAPATPQAVPGAPPTPGAPEGYVPSYRLRETREAVLREAQTAWTQREASHRAELDRIQSQLHALVGVQPPPNPQIDAVRNQFGQIYPGLASLEARAKDLEGLIERQGDLQAQNEHYWKSYGRSTMDRLFTHAQDSLGAPLTDEGKRQLHAAFSGFVQSSPELSDRYANDPSIVEDFWKQFTSSFIDPVRRTAAAATAQRVPGALPQDIGGGAPRVSGAPAPQNLDERVAQGWDMYTRNKP